MDWLSGWIYREGSFRRGSVSVEDGVIVSVTRDDHRRAIARGLILPSFVNHHTHLADAVVRQELRGSLEEIVAPPHGLKHRVLASAKDDEVVAAMRRAIDGLVATGSGSFWDFREGGLPGLRVLLRAALGRSATSIAFGRPSRLSYDRSEVTALLRVADGIGISSVLDWPYDEVAKLIGAPSFPITPTFPFLFPLGLLPYPVKYRLYFGEPMHFDGDPNDEDAVLGGDHVGREGTRARMHGPPVGHASGRLETGR